jgi:hypothetical protein
VARQLSQIPMDVRHHPPFLLHSSSSLTTEVEASVCFVVDVHPAISHTVRAIPMARRTMCLTSQGRLRHVLNAGGVGRYPVP